MNIHSASEMDTTSPKTSPKAPSAGALVSAKVTSAKGTPAKAAHGSAAGRDIGDKRATILRAALELFVDRGFHGTAVPDIAARAGVGAGTIYRYFSSKDVLVNELFRNEKMRFAREVIEGMPMTSGARELFRTLWMRMARFSIANTEALLFMEFHHHADYLDDESRALEQRMMALFAQVVVAAQTRGELKEAPPRLLMSIVIGGFVGVVRCARDEGHSLTEARWELAEQCMWEAIRA
jgi:TetR/AcrR family transcriptional regulator, repressor of fatR-cypB operon